MQKQYTLTLLFILLVFIGRSQETEVDSTILLVKSETIYKELFTAILKSNDTLYLLDSKENILFKNVNQSNFEFKDFNNDGYKDLILTYYSNIHYQDLILFDTISNTFIPVEKFSRFPEAKSVESTKYYYSYRRDGCADMNWVSDIFHIEDFKATQIGHISGKGCEGDNVKNEICIYKIVNENKKLLETLSIDTIKSYEDFKWGFIKEYWKKNYRRFE